MVKNAIKFGFILLDPTMGSYSATCIKTMMYEKKIENHDGNFMIYAPYKQIYNAHKTISTETGMWGIGFSLAALSQQATFDNKPLSRDNVEKYSCGELQCCKKHAKVLDFSALDFRSNAVFIVAPKRKECENVWFLGNKPGTTYKQWWCKGIHRDCCYTQSEDEIEKYLNGQTFNQRNYKEPAYDDLFPTNPLFDEKGHSNHSYKFLNLTPEELCERGKKGVGLYSEELL